MHYIYEIKNNINGKTYIGQHKYHETKLPENDGYMGSGLLITQALKKYGKNNFTKRILVHDIDTLEKTNELEIYFISLWRKYGQAEYNIADGGFGTLGTHVNKGKKCSEETKRKLSEINKGKKHSEEARKKISEALKGKPKSKEAIEKTASKNRGKKRTEEFRKRMSEINKGKISNNKGKPMSQEQKDKLRKALGKKVICVETGEIFDSAREVARKKNIQIFCCLRGEAKTAGGYHWKYA